MGRMSGVSVEEVAGRGLFGMGSAMDLCRMILLVDVTSCEIVEDWDGGVLPRC